MGLKRTLFFALFLISLSASVVSAQETSIGRVRVASFVAPRQVAPNSHFMVTLDVEYEVRTDVAIRALVSAETDKGSDLLWQSDDANVTGGGDRVWTVGLNAPSAEGTMMLSAYAYYLDNGRWTYYNDTVLGPGNVQVNVKVAKNASVQIELGWPGVQVMIDNQSATTSSAGQVSFNLPVAENYTLTVPAFVEFENSTRIIFKTWDDGSNQTHRNIDLVGDLRVVGFYKTQDLLRVTSIVPSYSWQEWYDTGSNVTIRAVNSPPAPWPLSSFGLTYCFVGWSGDVNSKLSEINFTMNSPKTVSADYSIDYSPLALPMILTVGVVGTMVLIVFRNRKGPQVGLESNFQLWCKGCGEGVEGEWTHCIHCGARLDTPD